MVGHEAGTVSVTDFNQQVIEEFRSRGGAVGGQLEGIPLVLLTHRGARSGVERTTPLGYWEDGDVLILFASNMGSPTHPAWFYNVAANAVVAVERGAETFEADAAILEGEARQAVWERLVQARPFLVDHQLRAGAREIPLVALRFQRRL